VRELSEESANTKETEESQGYVGVGYTGINHNTRGTHRQLSPVRGMSRCRVCYFQVILLVLAYSILSHIAQSLCISPTFASKAFIHLYANNSSNGIVNAPPATESTDVAAARECHARRQDSALAMVCASPHPHEHPPCIHPPLPLILTPASVV